jgi:predicted enzyme related to lactoylglutathione lyase
MMPRPGHFDLTADDPQEAMQSYKDVFGWKKFEESEGGQMEYCGWLLHAPRARRS